VNAPLRLALIVGTLLLVACGRQRESAQLAVSSLQAAAGRVAIDGARLEPQAYAAANAELRSLEAQLAAGQYSAVVQAAPATAIQFEVLGTRLAERRAAHERELQQRMTRWNKQQRELSELQNALEKRVQMLAHSARLPDNISREILERANAAVASQRAALREATALGARGDVLAALALAQRIASDYSQIMGEVGLAPALGSATR
jgi:hypothetical protein